ncbi:MAG: effector-associated domain EAD1-containing protein [Trebonia sp.]
MEEEIRFSPVDGDTLLRTLADLFDREDRAMRLLKSIRFPPSLIPDWREPGDSVSFWNQVFHDLDRGAMAGSYGRLLLAAHDTYQMNPILRDLHDRYIGPPFPRSVRPLSVDARTESADQPDLLFRVYIPAGRLYATQTVELLTMFYDWLSARRYRVRRAGYRTVSGEIIEFFAAVPMPQFPVKQEFDVFLGFLRLCASSPETAAVSLTEAGIDRMSGMELVARLGTHSSRLQTEVREQRERRITRLRHVIGAGLADSGVDLSTIPSGKIDPLLNDLIPDAVVPDPSILGWLPVLSVSASPPADITATSGALASGDNPRQPLPAVTVHLGPGVLPPPVNVTIRADQVINAMTYTVIENVQGTVNLAPEAKELLSLISRFTTGDATQTLQNSVHELEDLQAPQPARTTATQNLKKFLSDLSGKLPDAAMSVLVAYIETKLGVKG